MDHYRDPSGTESCNVQKPRLQVHIHGQWMLPSLMHSFVGQSSIRELCPPALLLLEGERTEGRKKREVLHLFRCYTHTYHGFWCNEANWQDKSRRWTSKMCLGLWQGIVLQSWNLNKHMFEAPTQVRCVEAVQIYLDHVCAYKEQHGCINGRIHGSTDKRMVEWVDNGK